MRYLVCFFNETNERLICRHGQIFWGQNTDALKENCFSGG